MDSTKIQLSDAYRHVFIVDSQAMWSRDNKLYNSNTDLILTYDLGFKKYIESLGGAAFYIDHLIDNQRMQKNNFLIYEFFQKWHFDENKKDIFEYKGIPFGIAFRLEIWNDFVSYIRTYLCLSALVKVKFGSLYLRSDNDEIAIILRSLNVNYIHQNVISKNQAAYYFPIAQWMDEKIRPKGFRAFLYKSREWLTAVHGYVMPFVDKLVGEADKTTVFIQEYHPTRQLLAHLRADNDIRVLLTNFSRGSKLFDNLSERLLPISGALTSYENAATSLMADFKLRKHEKLILDDGTDITTDVYSIIERRISDRTTHILRTLDGSISYLDHHPVNLEILIANIGHTATLFDCVCKSRKIPSYLIINGLLGPEYSDESKYATVINSYSSSIKKHYFREMDNIVTLGDPRMDMYPPSLKKPKINRRSPTITIGASGFNSVDLNSYVAVEFDFMYDVLSALSRVKQQGTTINVIIKVRGNGYRKQYEDFVAAYFPDLVEAIIDTAPMKDILMRTDFYISIYSQTLFEASCLGIPAVYYKKDNEMMAPPFDTKSELVTVTNVDGMVQAFDDFQSKHSRYNAFLDRQIMEKYIGPLDGGNLERNKAFVYELLDQYEEERENGNSA
jgi:hypothetical protein